VKDRALPGDCALGAASYTPSVETVAAKRLVLVAFATSLCATGALSALTFALGEFGDTAGRFRAMLALAGFTIVATPVGILGAFLAANLVNLLHAAIRGGARPPIDAPPARVDETPADDETVFRFRCTLDRYPDALPPSTGYRPLPGDAPVVECRLPARVFEDALARAVRELESCGARVTATAREGSA
jgi:hypothetical protein